VAVGARGQLRTIAGIKLTGRMNFDCGKFGDPIRSDCARESTATARRGDIVRRSTAVLVSLIRAKGIAKISSAPEMTPVEISQERHARERLQLALLAAGVGNYSHQY